MAHEDQFTATGPALTGSGFPRAGFSTNRAGADFVHGVNVEGSRCGVFGRSVKDTSSSRESDVDGVGIYGTGDFFGVYGKGNLGLCGVIGTHNNIFRPDRDGVGVVGATMRGGTGVVGISVESLTPLIGQKDLSQPADGTGVGVFGGSGDGAGVHGASNNGPGGEFLSSAGNGVSASSDSGTGVAGISGSGPGVQGTGTSGNGVEGISDSGIGVLGSSNSGTGAFFTSLSKEAVVGRSGGPGNGVRGSADSGSGVLGESNTGIGVRGNSTATFGVFGDSANQSGVVGRSRGNTAPGVFGNSQNFTGVAGRSTAGLGVYGESVNQAGVLGKSTSSAGVFGFGDAAFQAPAPPAGVLGINDKSVGVLGSSLKVIGVLGTTDTGLGVIGQANSGLGVPLDHITDNGIGVTGLGNAGFGVAGLSAAGTGVYGSSQTGLAGHFKGTVLIEGDLTVMGGNKSAAVPHPDGSHRQLYCMESPESWFEDFGEAQLVQGKADVQFDPGFADLVETDGYHIFLTPYGESKGIFVAERRATGFKVLEQQGGKSNLSFAYRVVAKRKGVTAARLARVTPPETLKGRAFPDLRLKIGLPDFERLSVNPLDLPDSEPYQ
jgi:hypothetical protein